MRRFSISFLLVSLIVVLTVACQETPEKEIVVDKSSDILTKKLEEELPDDNGQEVDLEDADPVDAPQKWNAHCEKYGGKFRMWIDADIIVSNAIQYPVAEIKPYYIPIEQVNKIVEGIYGTS